MLMTSLLLMTATAPLEARVTDIDLVRTPGLSPAWYNKVEVELSTATGRTVRLCPSQASVTTTQALANGSRPVGRYAARAMTVGRSYRTTCRDVALTPGQPQRVTFFVAGVPGRWDGPDGYTVNLAVGSQRFAFVDSAAR